MHEHRSGKGFHISRLTALFVGGAVLIISTCIGVIIWVLSVTTASVDATQLKGEHELLNSVFSSYQDNLAKSVADYSSWDELFNNFTLTPNRRWEEENLGPYVTKTFGIDFVAVVSDKGTVAYLYSKRHGDGFVPSAADAGALARLARLAAKADSTATKSPTTGVMMFDGTLSLVSGFPILPTSPNRIGERSGFNLVEIRALNRPFLTTIEQKFRFSGLRVLPAAGTGLELVAPSGTRSGFALVWAPSRTGHLLFFRILPFVVTAGALVLLALLALMTLWWRIVTHMRLNEARMLSAEIDATRARAHFAEEMARSKSAFIANMSHELRTPLNAIIGFSEMMECETLGPIGNPKYKEYIAAVNESGHHLLRIISDILLVSKVEAGKFAPNMEDVPVLDVIHDCVRMLSVIAAKRHISIETSACTCSGTVYVDKQALRQIIINVMSNALKFSPAKSVVDIACRCSDGGGTTEIIVSDHGCGIPPDTLSEIGKPFVQAELAYTRKHEGTGLGLAICYRLAEAMNVSIAIDSSVGVGTTVTLRVSSSRAEAAIPSPGAVKAA